MKEILIRSVGFLLIILLGYLCKVKGIAQKEDAKLFSTIIMNVTLPAGLLASASSLEFGAGLVVPFLIGLLSNFILDTVAYISRRSSGRKVGSQTLMQLSGYNIGAFTLPFVQAFFPPAYLASVLLFDAGNAIMVLGGNYTVAASLDPSQEKMGFHSILKNLFGSVPLAVYMVVLVLATFDLQVPSILLGVTQTAAQANPFLAMFMLGLLVDIQIDRKEQLTLAKSLALRFGVNACLAVLVYFCLPATLIVRQMLVICLMSPISTVAPVYSLKLGDQSARPANVNSLSIFLSLICLVILMLLFSPAT